VKKTPVILVTPDVTVRMSIGVDYRFYELKSAYADAVLEAGGLPWIPPYLSSPALVTELLARVDGVVLTGGDFDVDPRLFGAAPHQKLGTLKPDRTTFEMTILRGALALDMPVLGICGGMQLMNVEKGGTLFQDVPDERPGSVLHSQKHDRRHPAHEVRLTAGCTLARIYGQPTLRVNTSHHQAVRDVGTGLQATGVSEDGLVEVLEVPGARFAVGVQWHPETLLPSESDPRPRAVYSALVEAARAYGENRRDP